MNNQQRGSFRSQIAANLVPELKAANTTELNDASVCPKSADSVEKVYFG
jgi:hypothetical protein